MDDDAQKRFHETLATAAESIGISLTDSQLAQCTQFATLVVETNRTLNLTRITEPEAMAVKHFADSLTLLTAVPGLTRGMRLCDVGTGAGFPGVPLKIVRPDLNITLIDSLRKRLTFLEGALAALSLSEVALVHARAEDAGKLPLYAQKFDVVTARAVAALPKLLAWCAPLVKPGGLLVAMKGAEVEDDDGVAATLGLRIINQVNLTLPDPEGSQRHLIVYRRRV